MEDHGKLLYAGKTENNKNAIGFILVGIILFVAGYFLEAILLLSVIGGFFILIGLFLFIFKRSEAFSIYENTIVLIIKGQVLPIPKENIKEIEYYEMKARRGFTNYYPVLVLHDDNKVLINKSFNSVMYKDYRAVVES